MQHPRVDRGPGGESIAAVVAGLAALLCASGSLFRLAIPLGAVAVGLGQFKLSRGAATGEGMGRAAAATATGGVALVIGLLLLGSAFLANPTSSTLLGLPPSLALPGEAEPPRSRRPRRGPTPWRPRRRPPRWRRAPSPPTS